MPFQHNDSKLTLTLINDVQIVFKSGGKPDNLYGEDVYAVVLDEATRMREEAFFAVRTTVSYTGGLIRVIGNVKGRKNWAYRMARKAESGEKGLAHFVITAHDAIEAGILKQEEIDSARRDLPENIFNELYMAVPGEDEGNPFRIEHIRACIGPISRKRPKAWGWDLAKSVDWTVGVGLDQGARVCRFRRFQKPWLDTIREIREETGKCRAYVDSTGVGDPVLEGLQEDGGSNFEGFKFTGLSKQQLLEGLAVGIQKVEIGFPENSREIPIQSELEMMEYLYTRNGVKYSAPPGLHDDCVIGLGLSYQCLKSFKPVQIFT